MLLETAAKLAVGLTAPSVLLAALTLPNSLINVNGVERSLEFTLSLSVSIVPPTARFEITFIFSAVGVGDVTVKDELANPLPAPGLNTCGSINVVVVNAFVLPVSNTPSPD